MVAAADRDVPGGIRSGANSYSPVASIGTIVPARRPLVIRSFPGSHPTPGRTGVRTAGWERPDRTTTEDDVTDPGAANEADLAEQDAPVDGTALGLAGAVAGPEDGVPEADALEQQLAARPGEAGSPQMPVGDREANEADVLEQEADVPVDEDDARG
jgi:hypothetical protein